MKDPLVFDGLFCPLMAYCIQLQRPEPMVHWLDQNHRVWKTTCNGKEVLRVTEPASPQDPFLPSQIGRGQNTYPVHGWSSEYPEAVIGSHVTMSLRGNFVIGCGVLPHVRISLGKIPPTSIQA